MVMRKFAQLDGAGRVESVLSVDLPPRYAAQSQEDIEAGLPPVELPPDVPGLLLIQDGVAVEPRTWAHDGAGFVPFAIPAAEAAAERLREIDRESGMSRALREALIDLLPAGKGAGVRAKEAEAALERAKLK